MKHLSKHIGWVWTGLAALLVLVVGCSKGEFAFMDGDPERGYNDPDKSGSQSDGLAIGTLGSQDGARYVKLSETTCSRVMNPDVVKDIPDHTRIFLEFRFVVASLLSSCYTDAILVEWASPIDQGTVASRPFDAASNSTADSPVDIILDWMTSLEDGFLTLHYSILSSGNAQHTFSLHPTESPYAFRLVHDSHGDVKGAVTDGIVCFDVSALLPQTEGKTVELYLDYIDLNNTEKRLTVEYCSPK